MTVKVNTKGTKGLLLWIKTNQPDLYAYLEPRLKAEARKRNGGGMKGFGDITPLDYGGFDIQMPTANIPDIVDNASTAPTSGTFSSVLQNLVSAWGAAKLSQSQLETQNKITDIQLQRAQAGLPPLNIDAAGLGLPGINVGVSSSTQNTLMIVAGLLAAAYFIPNLLKHRR